MTLQFQNIVGGSLVYEGNGAGRIVLTGAGVGEDVPGFGAGRVAIVGGGHGSVSAGVGIPQDPATGMGQVRVRVAGAGFERLFGEGGAGRIGVRGMGIGVGTSFGSGRIGVRGEGTDIPPVINYGFSIKATPLMQAFANYGYGVMIEGIELASPASRLYTAMVRSVARLDEKRSQPYAGTTRVRDLIATEAGLSWMRSALLVEGLVLDSQLVPDWRALGRVISRLVLEDKVDTYAEALALVREAVTLITFEQALTLALVADDVELESQITSRYLMVVRVLEQLALEAAASGSFQMVALVEDAVLLEQIAAGAVDMVALLRDSVGLTLTLSFDDGQYIAWVLNTESAGLSRYTNYPFNSFMRIGQRYFGVHHGGIVELVGDTDDGAAIAARLRMGMFDFNDRHEKTFSDAFIGVATNGDLVLKVIFVSAATGEKNMAIYKVNYRPAGNARETRAKIGRGIQAVDWDFVLENIDGADLDLTNIQFNPVVGSRRTRG